MSVYRNFRNHLLLGETSAAAALYADHPLLLWGKFGDDIRTASLPWPSVQWLETQGVHCTNHERLLICSTLADVRQFYERLTAEHKLELFCNNVAHGSDDAVIRYVYPDVAHLLLDKTVLQRCLFGAGFACDMDRRFARMGTVVGLLGKAEAERVLA